MAVRPVFGVEMTGHPVETEMTEFTWYPGLSMAQRRRNIASLHAAYEGKHPGRKVLEISSKSMQALGVKLSAFNLTVHCDELGREISVECAYQGSKRFLHGGPYTDLYTGTSMDAKRDPRLKESGLLTGFVWNGQELRASGSEFYNWLYIRALQEHPALLQELLDYDACTDIVFNPQKSRACQAEAAAMAISLVRRGLLTQKLDFDDFQALVKRCSRQQSGGSRDALPLSFLPRGSKKPGVL